ncbi:MAG: hypothetical protein J6C89_06085 [Clostridia bacterium]|nr:hypothetical protein [Clostridia bacterium]
MDKIKSYITDNLSGEMKETALAFVEYLYDNGFVFWKDNCACWKDKIYYWVKYGEECVCFIAIKDPDEPNNRWTVWSEDSSAYEDFSVDENIKNIGWSHIDFCGRCGSCAGGKTKNIFGKVFKRVCGCTFRVDNAKLCDLPFLKKMVDLRKQEIIKT